MTERISKVDLVFFGRSKKGAAASEGKGVKGSRKGEGRVLKIRDKGKG
jgi:hypothetical protein